MRKKGTWFVSGLTLTVIASLSIPAVGARQTSTSLPSPADRYPAQAGTLNGTVRNPDGSKMGSENPGRERLEEEAAKARNTERFRRIQNDTDKLLKLATELKTDVDKSTKNEMSLDVIRKAAEVEKLAHDVKERMKG